MENVRVCFVRGCVLPHNHPGGCGSYVRNRKESDRKAGDTSGGRGQLREGDLRPATEEGVRGGRPSDNISDVAEEVSTVWGTRVHRDHDPRGDRGDRASAIQVGGDHYKEMPIQPAYFSHVNELGALEANVIKYVCRHHMKGGAKDLEKARHYIDLLLEWEYGHERNDKG